MQEPEAQRRQPGVRESHECVVVIYTQNFLFVEAISMWAVFCRWGSFACRKPSACGLYSGPE